MFAIDNVLVSPELLKKDFVCNLDACKGACCVEGESGAPLEQKEVKKILENLDQIKPYLTNEGVKTIEDQGVFVRDSGLKTPLMPNGACAFTVFDDGKAFCGIEKAYIEGKSDFRKPVSCHLYPIRIRRSEGFDWMEYESWEICDPACELGQALKVPVYRFVKDAIIRKYGKAFFDTLEAIDLHLNE